MPSEQREHSAAGQPPSFEAFAVAVATPLFRTAVLLCADWYLAEDLVQETLARIYRVWPVELEYPLAYARRTLARTFLSHRRRRSSGERPADHLPDRAAAEPDNALRRTLLDALRTLPDRDRAVLVLRYLADRSVADVAHDLGMSRGAVRVAALRALAKMRTALGDSEFDLVTG
jgi:RNA polymerase sigma-70 factor (sigma-E family)